MKATARLLTSLVVLACIAGTSIIHAWQPANGSFRSGDFRGQSSANPPRTTTSTAPRKAIAGTASAENPAADVRQQRAKLLLEARLQLAKRNTAAAANLANQTKKIPGTYSPLGDSPERIQKLIQRHQALDTSNRQNFQNPEFIRQYSRFLMDQAVGLMNYDQYDQAQKLTLAAKNLRPEFRPFESTPDKLLAKIAQQRQAAAGGIASRPSGRPSPNPSPGGGEFSGSGNARRATFNGNTERFPVQRGGYIPERDRTRNVAAGAQQDTPLVGPRIIPQVRKTAQDWYREGLRSLGNQDRKAAYDAFQKAWQDRDQLDPRTLRDLQDKLIFLRPRSVEPIPLGQPDSPLNKMEAQEQIVLQRLQADVLRERNEAEVMKKTEPREALRRLEALHQRVAEAEIPQNQKRQWLIIVDKSISEMKTYIEQNLAQIDTDEINRSRLAEVNQRRERTIEVQNELAQLVDKFNELMDQERYLEARVIARQAKALAPEAPVVETLEWKTKFVQRLHRQKQIRDLKEQGMVDAFESTLEIGIPYDDRVPLQFGDATRWRDLSEGRLKRARERGQQLSPQEMRIKHTLSDKKVQISFTNRPLRDVIDFLATQAGVNIHLDQKGLIAEGVASNQPVSINLKQPISLKSALNILLRGLNLGYVIQDEVINVTSVTMRNQNTYQKVYYVADLVIPIPNFVPSYNIGLPGAIAQAHQAMGHGGGFQSHGTVPFTVAANPNGGTINPVVNDPRNAQMLGNVGVGDSMSGARAPRPTGYGPSGLGGGPQADFDSLIQLITSTIEPESWDEVGGPGSVEGFDANLSLVVSQTQDIHEQIEDLLNQLRRLQDLQVTIELRFVTVSDSFFEFIGIDFDFDVDDNTGLTGAGDTGLLNDDAGPSRFFGLGADGNPTADLDLSFLQNSVAAVAPGFGGFDPNTAGTIGFAILSDIEVFFLLQAGQGNDRINVTQAPKATLFNGQQATISETTQQPFVTSVIPVVGDFAAAHQPVIVVLSEGVSLSVQAVVSSDRRYVRLTLVPFFSKIEKVDTFTFDGKKTIISGSGLTDPTTGDDLDDDAQAVITEGTTIQLPQFSFTSVTTTVSVPDGGTVLLGGAKFLNEERNEEGIPFLSKIPYINRLFKNTGIGRTTRSFMMMVTPRIIIQEEEEIGQTGLDSSQL